MTPGRIARWYVLLTDIEGRIRALARLEQMQSDFAHMNRVSMMGELAASLCHEITQGMGLSICRSIIDAHGRRLWTKWNEPRGAVFQFTLPGAEANP
jgi:K+-sensing histidine kinase KdpD